MNKKIGVVLALLFSLAGLFAQPSELVVAQAAPPPVGTVSASVVGAAGSTGFCYWVVAIYPVGKSVPVATCLANAPASGQLSVSRYVRINWQAANGATGYDVIRTGISNWPGSCSSCALANNTSSLTVNDTGGALSSYTGSVAPAALGSIRINNRDYAEPRLEATIPFQGAGGGGGDASTDTATSVDSQMATFKGTGGKLLQRAALTGVVKLTSGVASAVTGTGSNCVHVDGTSDTCGGGGGGSAPWCAPSSGSGTTYTCTVSGVSTYDATLMVFKPDITNTGAVTVNVNALGAKTVLRRNGNGAAAGELTAGVPVLLSYDGNAFRLVGEQLEAHADGSASIDRSVTPPNLRVTPGVFGEIGGSNAWLGANDFSGAVSTRPAKTGTSLPGACDPGQQYFKTNAPAGTNTYGCTSSGVWTLQGDGGGGSGDASTDTATSVDSQMATFKGTGGKLLQRAAFTGVVKLTSGVASAVTGTGSNCVHVDGTSDACGGGGGSSTVVMNFTAQDGYASGVINLSTVYATVNLDFGGTGQYGTWAGIVPNGWTGVAPTLRIAMSNLTSTAGNTKNFNLNVSCDETGSSMTFHTTVFTYTDTATNFVPQILTPIPDMTGCAANKVFRMQVIQIAGGTSTVEHLSTGISLIWPVS